MQRIKMGHFCWYLKLIFLLLMLYRTPLVDTRPARKTGSQSDLIAGNEFLKLFFQEEKQSLHSNEYLEETSISSSSSNNEDFQQKSRNDLKEKNSSTSGVSLRTSNRSSNARSLENKSKFQSLNSNEDNNNMKFNNDNNHNNNNNNDYNNKHLVKLVTTGSKIVFLEEFDDADEAIVDAVARELDLKKDKPTKTTSKTNKHQNQIQQQAKQLQNSNDEVKVVAVSVSSSSKRSQTSVFNKQQKTTLSTKTKITSTTTTSTTTTTTTTPKTITTTLDSSTTSTKRPALNNKIKATPSPALTLTTTLPTTSITMSSDFINRSHKSEFSIEEAEPLTMVPHKRRFIRPKQNNNNINSNSSGNNSSKQIVADSENSASTNVQKILAAPLVAAAASVRSHITAPPSTNAGNSFDNNSGHNVGPYQSQTQNQAQIQTQTHSQSQSKNLNHFASRRNATLHTNQNVMTSQAHVIELGGHNNHQDANNADNIDTFDNAGAEDKLLPFQTVIYHDTKEGHGPQSRSISYSSLSQNVADLQKWKDSSILAEAQRNVSESLKPILREETHPHVSEPAKFYSVPSKMYSVPAKFYSEPSKIYSEPAKIYGEPEKFYSEPAKVYSQPSKFYSEPAKVYSQPAKIYSEPAKTYWPQSIQTTSTPATSLLNNPPPITTSRSPSIFTTTPKSNGSSKKPAIVSRIAFGEAQSSTFSTTTKAPLITTLNPLQATTTTTTRTPSFHSQDFYQPQQSNHQHHHNSYHLQAHTTSQPRRLLFNLDKLPYDLLNAPEQSSKPLLEPLHKHVSLFNKNANGNGNGNGNGAFSSQLASLPNAGTNIGKANNQHTNDNGNGNVNNDDSETPCFGSPFSTTSLSLSNSQNHQLQRQHSSFSIQHPPHTSNGFQNKDLVKCVSQFSHSAASATSLTKENEKSTNNDGSKNNNRNIILNGINPASSLSLSSSLSSSLHFTTESSSHRHLEDLYTPTPEQNYEIEESVSVMSNGRAHGLQNLNPTPSPILAITTTPTKTLDAQPTTPATTATTLATNSIKRPSRISFGTKVNANVATTSNFGTFDGNNNPTINNGQNHHHHQQQQQYNHNQQQQQSHHHSLQTHNNPNHYHSSDDDYYVANEDEDSFAHGNVDDFNPHHPHTHPYPHHQNHNGDVVVDHRQRPNEEDAKVAYVLEGRNYRKYRVEEKTDEGFIVGEYGEVDHNVGNLRGVRYTADSNINPSLIQKGLLAFLGLK